MKSAAALCSTSQLRDGSERERSSRKTRPRNVGRHLYIRGLVAIVPTGLGNAARVARFCRWPAEHVPIGEPMRGLVPVRNPIAAGADHAVERSTSCRQGSAVISRDDFVDERIDDRIGYAGEILRAPLRGGLRGKKLRNESPGVLENPNRCTVRSKSKSSTRLRYCTGSTMRRLASMPSVPRFLMNVM